MAHGTPDWGVTAGDVTTFQLFDVGEAVARLGSIDRFDRRGDVMFLEDFERTPTTWEFTTSGAGAYAGLTTRTARSGDFALELTCGSTVDELAEAIAHVHYPVVSRVGLELHMRNVDSGEQFTARLGATNADGQQLFAVRLDVTAQTLAYLNSAGGYTVFATGVNVASGGRNIHPLKFVADLATAQYVRVLFDDRAYDLSGIAGRQPAATGTPLTELKFTHQSAAGANPTLVIDDVILTQNEPA